MIIDVHCISYNEEKIVSYFVQHYLKFCRNIFIWDNFSTDRTCEIAKSISSKVKINSWDGNGEINELNYLKLKESFRHYSLDADFVIVVDCDELVEFDLNYLVKCKNTGITLPKVIGVEMVHDNFDFKSPINIITRATPKSNLNKRVIFNPKLSMRWDVGCHPSEVGNSLLKNVGGVEDDRARIIMKHYKWVDIDYVIARYNSYSKRLSQFNRKNYLGIHYLKTELDIKEEHRELMANSKDIVEIMGDLK